MILGFGAIMTFPLRVEYLSKEDQLNLSNQEIVLVTIMVFFGAKILSMHLWGKLFDHMHFMKFRIILNILMIIAILIYFNSKELIGVLLGSALAEFGNGWSKLSMEFMGYKIISQRAGEKLHEVFICHLQV